MGDRPAVPSCFLRLSVAVLLLPLLWFHCRAPRPLSEAEVLLDGACRYLWSRQDHDGGWHSETYGLLRGGQAWTPFIVHALTDAPGTVCPRPAGGVGRALAFIRSRVNPDGVLGLADPDVLEYPNYATAYALRVLVRHGDPADRPLVGKMTAYLLGQQFVEHRGFEAGDPAYGSWGFGETRLPPGRTGHVDLSHTRRVLQALRDAGHDDPATYRKAGMFLRLAQKHPLDARLQAPGLDGRLYDGGFYASPVVPGVNKSAPVPDAPAGMPVFDSYATATSDGLLALLAAGLDADDEPVRAAARWLRGHPALADPEGIPENDAAGWRRVLFFYHLSVRAEACRALDEPGDWPLETVRLLAGRQRADGSFSNPDGAPNKEDDPLLATAMAVQALSHALHTRSREGAAERKKRLSVF